MLMSRMVTSAPRPGAGHAGAQHYDLGRADARDAAQEHARAAGGGHEGGGADLHREPACDLGHRGEQRKGAAFLDRLVGDRGDAGVDELPGQFRLCGEVEVGEEDQTLAKAVVFGLDGFLDLHDHVGAAPDVIGVGDDLSAGDGVLLVRDAGAQAGAALHQDRVAVGAELVDAGGRDGDAEFVVLDLFGDTDDHLWAPRSLGFVGRKLRGICVSRIDPAVRQMTGWATKAGAETPGFTGFSSA